MHTKTQQKSNMVLWWTQLLISDA